jgi:hypothetical protein
MSVVLSWDRFNIRLGSVYLRRARRGLKTTANPVISVPLDWLRIRHGHD